MGFDDPQGNLGEDEADGRELVVVLLTPKFRAIANDGR